jgi:hypothetical protein
MDELEEALIKATVDELYREVKVQVTAANGIMKANAPRGRSGNLAAATGCAIASDSDATTIKVNFYSNPAQTAPYNSLKKDFGQVDYANFTNKRGATVGWFDRAVAAAKGAFR